MSEFYVYEEDDRMDSEDDLKIKITQEYLTDNLIKNKNQTLDHKQLECHIKKQTPKNVQIVQNQKATSNLVTEQQTFS
jgi:hypothetical protein